MYNLFTTITIFLPEKQKNGVQNFALRIKQIVYYLQNDTN